MDSLFRVEQIIHPLTPAKASLAAGKIVGDCPEWSLYSGTDYDAVSSGNKSEALELDWERAKKPSFAEGIAVGLGDSEGDFSFLGLQQVEGYSAYLPFFVGKLCLSTEQEVLGIIRTNGKGPSDTKVILKVLLAAHQRGLLTLATVFADKDKTIAPSHQEPDSEMVRLIADLLLADVRFVVVSSNDPGELTTNLIEPVSRKVGELSDDQALKNALLGFEVYFNNGLSRKFYDSAKKAFVTEHLREGKIPDEVKAMLFKIYTEAFLNFLESPEGVLESRVIAQEPDLVEKLREIRTHIDREAHDLMRLEAPDQIRQKFDDMVRPHQAILGAPHDSEPNNVYLRTWADAFCTIELAEANPFFQSGAFTAYVKNRVREWLRLIYSRSSTG